MEERISKIAVTVMGSSVIIIGLLLFGTLGFGMIVFGDTDLQQIIGTLKIVLTLCLYLASIYLLRTLPGKKIKRRFFSWAFALLFNVGLLVYVSVLFDAGLDVLIVGFAEVIISVLCSAGLFVLGYNYKRDQKA